MKMRIRGMVRVNAEGKQLCRFINALRDEGVEYRALFSRGGLLSCDVPARDIEKLRSIASQWGVELSTAEHDSLSVRLYRYRRRFGIIIGILLAAAAALYFSQVVVTIEIQGNSSVSDELILAALAELDVKAGTPLRSIDLRFCESRLRSMVDGIAWVGIRHTGSRIVVQITETEPQPAMLRDRIPCNLVASRDAEITSVLVRRGELVRVIGDYVPKGTLLVSGVSEDEKGRTFIYHAMGEIRGSYTENVSFSAAFRSEENIPTGRTYTRRSLRLFSLDIPLSFGQNRYKSFTCSRSQKRPVIFGRELPLGTDSCTYTETVPETREYTEQELTDKLMERVFLYEKNFLSKDTVILKRDISTSKNDDVLTLSVAYELESVISEQRDIYLK